MTEWLLSSSTLILIMVLLRGLLKGRVSPGLQYALWLIVLLRLLIPVSPFESRLSVAGLAEAAGERWAASDVPSEPWTSYQAEDNTPPAAPAQNGGTAEVTLPADQDAQGMTSTAEKAPDASASKPAAAPAGRQAGHVPVPSVPILYALWGLGAAAVLGVALVSNRRFGKRLRRGMRPLPGQRTLPPRLIYISDHPGTPCLFGLLCPAIYVPASIALDEAALGHVLAHERAHYRHGDQLWSVLRILVLALHWYNPLVWWACVLSKRDAETAADAAAIAWLGERERADYGRTLIGLVARSSRPVDLFSCGTAMYGSRRTVKERVRLIAKKPQTAILSLVLVVLVCAAAVRLTYTGTGKGGVSGATNTPLPAAAPAALSSERIGAPEVPAEETLIKPVYTIPEDAVKAPQPNPALFGSTTDPDELQAVIDAAAELLNGQPVIFDPKADFQPGKKIQYYSDETILVITWKEIIDGKCCSFSEVKIADGSQLRRKLSGDSYGTEDMRYASELAASANAVVALNGDFYAFRNTGVTVYQGQVYRCAPDETDTCFFTANGDMLFSYAGELKDEEETRRYVQDNEVLFSLAFGPVLVDDGQMIHVTEYPVGEINTTYSRSAVGQVGELHYLLMTVNYDEGYTVAATIQEAARFMAQKGCEKAYALDGGQTSELLMNGEPVNHIDFGVERQISDILYFATALPEESWQSGQ